MTINYRLGVFGNLTYPGLKDGGTFGLLDQLAALKWARANARAFGGDPHNVAKDAQAFATQGAAALDCTDAATAVDCLRGKEVEKLLGLEVPFNAPSYDNCLLPRDPAEALRAGRFQRMPLLSGGNRDEANGSAAAIEAAGHLTEDAYQDLLADSFGADAPRVAARDPASAYQMPAAAWGAVATDRAWACPTLARGQPAAGEADPDVRLRVRRPHGTADRPGAARLPDRRVARVRPAVRPVARPRPGAGGYGRAAPVRPVEHDPVAVAPGRSLDQPV